MVPLTITSAVSQFLNIVRTARSDHTARAYGNALKIFVSVLAEHSIDPATAPTTHLSEAAIGWLAAYLKNFSPATERLYLQAASGFYQFLAAEGLADVNLARLKLLIRQRGRRPGVRLPQFPTNEIERVLEFVAAPTNLSWESEEAHLRALRDRAFLLTLADTGLRVHEACDLRRGDIDWNEGRAVVIGKGDEQAVVRFTARAMQAMKDYLGVRAGLDGRSGKQLSSLPLFARHDKGAGQKVKPMTPTTGRNIVKERVTQFLGKEMVGRITPHSFRHYFVTSVLRGTGNLRYAQELARHKSTQVTQRYTHLSNDELDKAYYEVFERKSKKSTP